jgi:hypothetical protein
LTVAPANTSLFSSVTRPLIDEVVTCAMAAALNAIAMVSIANRLKNLNFINTYYCLVDISSTFTDTKLTLKFKDNITAP